MSKEPTDQRAAENSWYYLLDGETLGPVPGAQLRQLFRTGELDPDTLVWRAGMRDWLPARALGVGTAQPPVAPTAAVPVRTPTPPRNESRSDASGGAAARSRVARPTAVPRRSTKRRVQLVVVGVLTAAALLLCGVGIGVLLRSPAAKTGEEPRAVARKDEPPPRNIRSSADTGAGRASESDAVSERPLAPPALPRQDATNDHPASGRSVPLPVPEDRAAAPREPIAQSAPSAAPDPPVAAPSTQLPADATSVLYQVIDMHRRPSFGLSGISMTQDIRYQILSRLELAPRAADGTQKVIQVVEQSRLDQADEMSRGTYETALRALIGQRYAFSLNDRGEIVEFTGFKPATTAAPVSHAGEEGFMVVTVIDEDGWKELAQLTFLQPDRSIASGQPWKRPMAHDWSPLGSWRGTTTYTQRGPEGTGTRYDYTHEMNFVPAERSSGVLPFDITGASFRALKATGWFVFDPERRQVTSVHEEYQVEGTVGAGLPGGAAELQLQEIQETTIQISGQNPWVQVR
ncbi:MAG: DUF4339 domain-containing protein [Pirellulaceae bacterium]